MTLSTCNFCDAEYDPYDDHTCKGNQILARKRPGKGQEGWAPAERVPLDYPPGWGPSQEVQTMLAQMSPDNHVKALQTCPMVPPISSALSTQPGGDHYRKHAIQPVEYIVANGIGFLPANIIKYATRYKDKGGAADIRKIIHYAQLILEFEYKEPSK